MQYPEDARSAALSAAFRWLAIALVDGGIVDAERFLNAMANAGTDLARDGNELAAHALRDLVEPLADHWGYRSEPQN